MLEAMGKNARFVVAGAALLGACQKRSGDPTADWFAAHRKGFETIREMLAADHGLVTHVGLSPLGGIRDAGGAKGTCGSELRGGGFPWKCTGDFVAKDLGEVEAFLGVPRGRLDAYARALPAKSVGPGEPCAPPGSLVFWLQDPDSPPCKGITNVVWSLAPPAPKTDDACSRTVATHFVPLGDSWYEDACVAQTK